MLADLVEKLVGLGRKSAESKIVPVPADRRKVFFIHNGEVELHDIPPPDRDPILDGMSDLGAFLTNGGLVDKPEVYVSRNQIVAFLNGADRRERATMPIEIAQQFRTLQGMHEAEAFSPADAIRFLRFKLPDGNVGAVINALSQVDFVRSGSGVSTTEHGRESLGRAVEAKVQQSDKIPETFKVRTKVFSNTGMGSVVEEVTVGVYLNVAAEAVEFQVLPDQCERAMRRAVDSVVALAVQEVGEGIPVFAGSPRPSRE